MATEFFQQLPRFQAMDSVSKNNTISILFFDKIYYKKERYN